MKEANRNYIAVGAFVLSMLAALVVWFAILSGAGRIHGPVLHPLGQRDGSEARNSDPLRGLPDRPD